MPARSEGHKLDLNKPTNSRRSKTGVAQSAHTRWVETIRSSHTDANTLLARIIAQLTTRVHSRLIEFDHIWFRENMLKNREEDSQQIENNHSKPEKNLFHHKNCVVWGSGKVVHPRLLSVAWSFRILQNDHHRSSLNPHVETTVNHLCKFSAALKCHQCHKPFNLSVLQISVFLFIHQKTSHRYRRASKPRERVVQRDA